MFEIYFLSKHEFSRANETIWTSGDAWYVDCIFNVGLPPFFSLELQSLFKVDLSLRTHLFPAFVNSLVCFYLLGKWCSSTVQDVSFKFKRPLFQECLKYMKEVKKAAQFDRQFQWFPRKPRTAAFSRASRRRSIASWRVFLVVKFVQQAFLRTLLSFDEPPELRSSTFTVICNETKFPLDSSSPRHS